MDTEIRIVEVKDGFNHKFYVQYKVRWLFFSWWATDINPDHKEWTGKDFPSMESAKTHIDKCMVPKTKIIHQV